jgi:UDP-glucuronate 4-epimerase
MTQAILVTGAAGFIGFHTSLKLLKKGLKVVGVDCINDYYDVKLKYARLEKLKEFPDFSFHKFDLVDLTPLNALFEKFKFSKVIHLAAQAGVRYSLINPHAYITNNISAFTNILEVCRHHKVDHLVYASSSSVYGSNKEMPFSVSHNVDHPVSLYAATKKSNELMAHTYSHLFNLPTTGLRFFTVYGPWGRPDMALYLFTKAILEDKPINVFNFGEMRRDFTYIDDITEGIIRICDHIPTTQDTSAEIQHDPSISHAPYQVFNIGNDKPVELNYMIELIEKALGKKAQKNLMPLQDGDVPATWANIDPLKEIIGFTPQTSIETGIENFVSWYKEFYKLSITH